MIKENKIYLQCIEYIYVKKIYLFYEYCKCKYILNVFEGDGIG